MSQDKQNPDTNKDSATAESASAPEQNHSDSPAAAGAPAEPGKKSRGAGRFLLVLALLLLAFGAGGYAAYYYLDQRFTESAQENSAALADLEADLNAVKQQDQALRAAQQNLQQVITAMAADTEDQLLALAERISASEAEGSADWTLAEAEYLLRIANQRLVTSRDQGTALEMMRAADDILRELAYPELAAVRRQLAEDIARVQMAGNLDVQGLFFELEALALEVADLPHFEPESLEPQSLEPKSLEPEFPAEAKTDVGARLWHSIRSTLAQYVRIDTQAGEPQYLLSEEQQLAQTLAVQLQIRQAQLAMLSGRQQVFARALESAADSIEDFYIDNDRSAALRTRLREIAEMRVRAETLDISASIRALSAVVDQLSRLERE